MPVCADSFEPQAAAVVCRDLGWVGGLAAVDGANAYGRIPSNATLALAFYSSPGCTDSGTLLDCTYLSTRTLTGSLCTSAAVTCSNSTGAAAFVTLRRRPRLPLRRPDGWPPGRSPTSCPCAHSTPHHCHAPH